MGGPVRVLLCMAGSPLHFYKYVMRLVLWLVPLNSHLLRSGSWREGSGLRCSREHLSSLLVLELQINYCGSMANTGMYSRSKNNFVQRLTGTFIVLPQILFCS